MKNRESMLTITPRTIRITSNTITAILLCIILFLLAANLLTIYLKFVMGHKHLKGLFHGFYFDFEANLPSFYSALAILFSAVLLWLIGNSANEKQEKRSFYWKFLSFVFAFLAVDEFVSIHEDLIKPMQSIIDLSSPKSNYLYFGWLIPYSLLCLAVGIISFKSFFKLPLRTRMLFIIAGIIFLSGAVVMEMVGGNHWASQGWSIDGTNEMDLRYALIITVEELLEMLGIVVFIHALTTYYLKDKNNVAIFIQISDAERLK
jgi:hypothetical protein